jgi:hypothetical protein
MLDRQALFKIFELSFFKKRRKNTQRLLKTKGN